MSRNATTRRHFLRCSARQLAVSGTAVALASGGLHRVASAAAEERTAPLAELLRRAPQARFWISGATAREAEDCGACHGPGTVKPSGTHRHEDRTVRCLLCAQQCEIADGERGRCRARFNLGGELRTLVYGRPLGVHVDPIEKKPFYHFLPGRQALSFGTAGCPLHCQFCQNWQLSQSRPEDRVPAFVSPARMARAAGANDVPVIAFTYNEPTVFTEYMLDVAHAARAEGIRTVLVSCGFMTERPLAAMCEALDAIKIDLKGYSEAFYREVCSARLRPVLRSIAQIARSGVHLELVNLVVPTLNDSRKALADLSDWVAGELGPDVPVHFTRFHPDYRLQNLPPTPVATLERAREVALAAGLRYPYVGNVPGHPGNSTYCPGCNETVIERTGFFVTANRLANGRCPACKTPVAGVWG
jgi:pyruvate formate lyase activating enzyme